MIFYSTHSFYYTRIIMGLQCRICYGMMWGGKRNLYMRSAGGVV